MELPIVQLALIGILLVASVALLAKGAASGDMIVAGGNVLWLWAVGGFLIGAVTLYQVPVKATHAADSQSAWNMIHRGKPAEVCHGSCGSASG
jgi:uncharacterized membrane protein YedE/YeeE